MIVEEYGALHIEGPITFATAESLRAAGCAHLVKLEDGARIDMSGVTKVDSSALAVLIAWVRYAESQGRRLSFSAVPQSLLSLAELYGVAAFLPLQPDAGS